MSNQVKCYACDSEAQGMADRRHSPEGSVVPACKRHAEWTGLAYGEGTVRYCGQSVKVRALVAEGSGYVRPYRLEGLPSGTRTFKTVERALDYAEDRGVEWEVYPE